MRKAARLTQPGLMKVVGSARTAVVSRPGLWERLGGSARVTVVSAPPGSGKTILLRSWISAEGLAERAAWVPVGRNERDPQRFWLAVLDALRQTVPGSALVRAVTAAPDLDGWAIVERLLKDLAPLGERLWLVIDDLHELSVAEARQQLELLVMRAPAELRFALATRHDVRLGLHRLRLEGELTEIRVDDLRFTMAEAQALFHSAGIELAGPALRLLYERTEGWAAGLRLAALSLAGHPDPERFAKEFSGSERTVAEYLLAEVLERQGEEVRRLLAAAEAPDAAGEVVQPGLSENLRALALISLGNAETWTGQLDQAELHLEQAVALAHRIGQPYLEFMGLVFRAQVELPRCAPRAAELSRQVIELAEQHGWNDDTFAGLAYNALGSALVWQGRLDEAETWVQRAERAIRAETEPMSAMGVQFTRGMLELGRGRVTDALAAFRTAERLVGPHPLARPLQAFLVRALVRLGDIERAEQVLAGLGEHDRDDPGQTCVAAAVLRLARDDSRAATVALAAVLDGSAPVGWRFWLAEAFLLEAMARDALGDPAAAGRAVERSMDLAGPDGTLLWFLLHPAPGLLERQARQRTAHAALIAEILDLLAGNRPAPRPAGPRLPLEPLSNAEVRVLRYLPTHLSAPEIASELSVSTSTVKTHMSNLYGKLGAHRRAEAVERARTLGLLAPSVHLR